MATNLLFCRESTDQISRSLNDKIRVIPKMGIAHCRRPFNVPLPVNVMRRFFSHKFSTTVYMAIVTPVCDGLVHLQYCSLTILNPHDVYVRCRRLQAQYGRIDIVLQVIGLNCFALTIPALYR